MKDKKDKISNKPKKVKKTNHILIKDVIIGDILRKKGDKVDLTIEGFKYFKSLNYI